LASQFSHGKGWRHLMSARYSCCCKCREFLHPPHPLSYFCPQVLSTVITFWISCHCLFPLTVCLQRVYSLLECKYLAAWWLKCLKSRLNSLSRQISTIIRLISQTRHSTDWIHYFRIPKLIFPDQLELVLQSISNFWFVYLLFC